MYESQFGNIATASCSPQGAHLLISVPSLSVYAAAGVQNQLHNSVPAKSCFSGSPAEGAHGGLAGSIPSGLSRLVLCLDLLRGRPACEVSCGRKGSSSFFFTGALLGDCPRQSLETSFCIDHRGVGSGGRRSSSPRASTAHLGLWALQGAGLCMAECTDGRSSLFR